MDVETVLSHDKLVYAKLQNGGDCASLIYDKIRIVFTFVKEASANVIQPFYHDMDIHAAYFETILQHYSQIGALEPIQRKICMARLERLMQIIEQLGPEFNALSTRIAELKRLKEHQPPIMDICCRALSASNQLTGDEIGALQAAAKVRAHRAFPSIAARLAVTNNPSLFNFFKMDLETAELSTTSSVGNDETQDMNIDNPYAESNGMNSDNQNKACEEDESIIIRSPNLREDFLNWNLLKADFEKPIPESTVCYNCGLHKPSTYAGRCIGLDCMQSMCNDCVHATPTKLQCSTCKITCAAGPLYIKTSPPQLGICGIKVVDIDARTAMVYYRDKDGYSCRLKIPYHVRTSAYLATYNSEFEKQPRGCVQLESCLRKGNTKQVGRLHRLATGIACHELPPIIPSQLTIQEFFDPEKPPEEAAPFTELKYKVDG
jgi:hypothetical protein